MNKNILLIITIFIVVISYIFNINNFIKNQFLTLNNNISSFYLDTLLSIESNLNKYFKQLQTIEKLSIENKELIKYKALYNANQELIKEYNTITDLKLNEDFQFHLVKALSRYSLYDNSILKIDLDYDTNKTISPLLSDNGFSAGIIIKKNNLQLAYLNNNKKCNYTVFIGEQKAPGITSGMDENGNLIIKHIPKWIHIKQNDEIITSNMDNIFPFGIRVGKVSTIQTNENTKTIKAVPYGKTFGKRYFYTISKGIEK